MEPEQLEELRHSNTMEELEKAKENIELKAKLERDNTQRSHDLALERERIDRAERRKDDMRWLERQKELHLFKSEHWNMGKPFDSRRARDGIAGREHPQHSAPGDNSEQYGAQPETH